VTRLHVKLYNRDYSDPQTVLGGDIAFEVQTYSWGALGGCDRAEITVTGSNLWQLTNALRCPVEIYDDTGQKAWWGEVHEVEIPAKNGMVGVSLENMANNVAVAYSYVEPGASSAGTRGTTAWSSDADSVAEYGTKDALISVASIDSATAVSMRDTILAQQKNPSSLIDTSAQRDRATMYCRGWFDTLKWRYYSQSAGLESHTAGSAKQKLGLHRQATTIFFDATEGSIEDSHAPPYLGEFEAGDKIRVSGSTSNDGVYTIASASAEKIFVNEAVVDEASGATVTITLVGTYIAQSFQSSTAWSASTVKLPVLKHGSPSDNLQAKIYSDSAGAPNTLLATGSVAGSAMSTQSTWETFTLDSAVSLSASTTYWVYVVRSGTDDAADYYEIACDEGLGYASGKLLVWDGTTWATRSPDADMQFKVGGVLSTTTQISDLITTAGQFFAGSSIEDTSGISTSQYRDGDATAYDELIALLEIGTTNNLRLIAEVTSQRYLRIFEEASRSALASADNFYLTEDRRVISAFGHEMEPHLGFYAKWLHIVGIPPHLINASTVNSPSPVFIERAEYNAKSNILRLEPRGTASPWDIGRIV